MDSEIGKQARHVARQTTPSRHRLASTRSLYLARSPSISLVLSGVSALFGLQLARPPARPPASPA